MYQFERDLLSKGHQFIAGTDEVGRGPLAGPVVAAAVILDPQYTIEGLNDSKKLTEKKREQLAKEIIDHALDYQIVFISPEEIDEINIYQASRKAMMEAIQTLSLQPTFVLSDAMPLPDLHMDYLPIIKGDSKSATIAAASIIAKVARDEYMIEMSETYPEYGFEKHKGYPTKQHLEALKQYGVTPIHRKTYAPVRDVLKVQLQLKL